MPAADVPEFLTGVARPGDGAWEASLEGTAPADSSAARS
jgi:hypothetical protein